jgi:hypothetical protein
MNCVEGEPHSSPMIAALRSRLKNLYLKAHGATREAVGDADPEARPYAQDNPIHSDIPSQLFYSNKNELIDLCRATVALLQIGVNDR